MPDTLKSRGSRHSKITGDFGEALVLYWLSRDAFECARIDHVGIDLLARNPHTGKLMGISVKSRSRFRKNATASVSVNAADFDKIKDACRVFDCDPYFAIVVDGVDWIRVFLTSMDHFISKAKPGKGKVHWEMTEKKTNEYRADDQIMSVEFKIVPGRWWEPKVSGAAS